MNEKESKEKFIIFITIIVIISFTVGIIIWYNNYLWSQGNCYNTLINASSDIIKRCVELGISP